MNSKKFPQAQRKREKNYERSYETEKDKTKTIKIFLIGSPEKKHRADRGENVLVLQTGGINGDKRDLHIL